MAATARLHVPVGPVFDILSSARVADERIRPFIRETYVERSAALSDACRADVFCKLENLQFTGSFKARGALNKVLSLTHGERSTGVVAASTGNHGAAVARSAGLVDAPCLVFVPEHVDPSKLANIRQFGAKIELHGADSVEAEVRARAHADAHGWTYISPYNDLDVVAGQATVGIELARQLDRVDTVFVALGGGGLISGVAGVLKQLGRSVRVVACSPANSAVMAASVRAGRILDVPSQPTLSDGTAGGVEDGAITFELCRALVDDYLTVTEPEIVHALRSFIDVHHFLIEGAAAVAVAGLQQVAASLEGETVVVILCGGNIGIDTLRTVL